MGWHRRSSHTSFLALFLLLAQHARGGAKYGDMEVQTVPTGQLGVLDERVPAVFLLGYQPTSKPAVASRLASLGGRVLQHFPSTDHWLVHTTPAALQSLQQEFPSVTVALWPEDAKVSSALQRLVGEMKQHDSAGSWGSSQPGWLQDIRLRQSSDGLTQIMLSINRPAFTTVRNAYCSACPERAEAQSAAEAWAHGLRDGLTAALSEKPGNACYPVIQSSSTMGVSKIAVCLNQLDQAASWLAKQGEVISVSIVSVRRPTNLHAGRAVQSGAHRLGLPDDFRSNVTQRDLLFPFWAANITGEGQVEGVADSGMDLNHCYFWDPAFPNYHNNSDNIIEYVTDQAGNRIEGFVSNEHRKVQSYFFFRDRSDDPDGHGTHVAGTVAGSLLAFDPVVSPDLATGVAPKARIAFFDVADAAGDFDVPEDPATILRVLHDQGARIASNSWGYMQNYEYDDHCKGIDSFLWANDQLAFFSAGNAGRVGTPGVTGTVHAPATCKNVLAIGSTDNHYFRVSTPEWMINGAGQQINFTDIRDTVHGGLGPVVASLDGRVNAQTPYDFVSSFSSYGNASLGYIMPQLTAPGSKLLSADADSTYDPGQETCSSNVTNMKGTSMSAPVAAGAAAMMRQYFTDGFYPSGSKVPEDGFDPSASLLMATLVAGAESMRGYHLGRGINNASNLTMFDENQGFGRVSLSRLPLAGVTDPSWKLQVWQRGIFADEGASREIEVSAIGNSPIIVALAWMDLPAESGDGEPLLRNDLDLKVVAPSGIELWGNDRLGGDRSNTIEKVIIDFPEAGEYTINITCVSMDAVEGPQSYSVVALGGIEDRQIIGWSTPNLPPGPPSPSPPPPPSPASPPPSPPSPSPAPPSPAPPPVPSPPSSPPTPASPVAPLPPELEATLQVNERQVDVIFVVDISKEDLAAMRDPGSSLYEEFKRATESLFSTEMVENSQVLLLALNIATRRRLLQSATIMGRYVFRAPEGASKETARSGAQSVISKLNGAGGVGYLNGAGLAGFKIMSTSATDTTPSDGGDSGPTGGGRASVLGPAIAIPVAVALLSVGVAAYICAKRRRRAPPHPSRLVGGDDTMALGGEAPRGGAGTGAGAPGWRNALSVLGGWVGKGGAAMRKVPLPRMPRLTRGSRMDGVAMERGVGDTQGSDDEEGGGSTWKSNPLAALRGSRGERATVWRNPLRDEGSEDHEPGVRGNPGRVQGGIFGEGGTPIKGGPVPKQSKAKDAHTERREARSLATQYDSVLRGGDTQI